MRISFTIAALLSQSGITTDGHMEDMDMWFICYRNCWVVFSLRGQFLKSFSRTNCQNLQYQISKGGEGQLNITKHYFTLLNITSLYSLYSLYTPQGPAWSHSPDLAAAGAFLTLAVASEVAYWESWDRQMASDGIRWHQGSLFNGYECWLSSNTGDHFISFFRGMTFFNPKHFRGHNSELQTTWFHGSRINCLHG